MDLYKFEYLRYKQKCQNLENILLGGSKDAIDIDKEVKKRLPNVNKDFLNLYFAIKAGMMNYYDDSDLEVKEVAMNILKLAKKQIKKELEKEDKMIKIIVKGLNKGKKKGKTVTTKEIMGYMKTFDKMYKKQKYKSRKDFYKYLFNLLKKVFDAEHIVIDKFS